MLLPNLRRNLSTSTLLRIMKPSNQASLLACSMRRANRSARLIGRVSASTSTSASASASAAGDRRMIVRPMRLVGMCARGMARGAGAARAKGDGTGRAEAKRGEVRSMKMKLRTVVRRKEDLANMLVDLVWCGVVETNVRRKLGTTGYVFCEWVGALHSGIIGALFKKKTLQERTTKVFMITLSLR